MSKLQQEIGKRGPFQSMEQEVYLNVLRTADALAREFDELFKRFELSSPLYNVLRILRGAGDEGLGCSDIGQRMIARDPDVTRLLDRLEKRGLATRSRGQIDRRCVRSRITPAALELLSRLDEPIAELHRKQLAHLSHQDMHTLIELLERARSANH